MLCVAFNVLRPCARDICDAYGVQPAQKLSVETVKKLNDTFNVVNSLSMVGDDSFVKQKTADNLVDEDSITNASEEDSTTMFQWKIFLPV